jgi:release factor glutamine methyltransferase
MPGATRRVVALLADGFTRLAAAGVETPRLDAELLLAHVLGVNRAYLHAHPDRILTPDQETAFEALLRRREAREPLPYLLGRWEFLGMPFRVTPAVLIPRPETETLVEGAAARLRDGARILDVGAGSGCVGIGLAKLLPGARVTALEPSAEAAAVAQENAAALGVSDRVEVIEGWFPGAAAGLGLFDAVVSNPPYIPSADVERLAPELRLYEPRLALDGGADGLDVIRALAAESPAVLRPGGLLAIEIALGQSEAVTGLLKAQRSRSKGVGVWECGGVGVNPRLWNPGPPYTHPPIPPHQPVSSPSRLPTWNEPEIVPDLAGIPRAVFARLEEPGP